MYRVIKTVCGYNIHDIHNQKQLRKFFIYVHLKMPNIYFLGNEANRFHKHTFFEYFCGVRLCCQIAFGVREL